MQTLKSIKKRIVAVKGTMKIVSAMKMTSASKLKRVQADLEDVRLYNKEIKKLALQITAKSGGVGHPAFVLRPKTEHALVIVIGPERGLCGALAENMFRQIDGFSTLMKERGTEVEYWGIGAKVIRTFKKHDVKIKSLDVSDDIQMDDHVVIKLCADLLNKFLEKKYDQIIIAYYGFVSALSNHVSLDMFLPIWVKDSERPGLDNGVDFLYEPGRSEVIEMVVGEALRAQFVHALVESRATEFASRMVAMDKASKNAEDMVGKMSREYNRVRQASITRELMDIVGGAEALKA
jgi:F-type H+-transporting ATPase subunit gamma